MEALVGKRIRPLTALARDLAEPEPDRNSASQDGMRALNQVLGSVRKYKRLVVLITTVGTLLVAAVSLYMPRTYLASAQLAIDIRQSGAADARGGASPTLSATAEEAIIDTHVTVLLSDAFLRRVLPAISTSTDAANDRPAEIGTWSDQLRELSGGWFGMFKKSTSVEGAALAALKRSLRVAQERRSRIISVTAVHRDPQQAAAIANAVAESYVREIMRQLQVDVETALNSLSTLTSKVQADLVTTQEQLTGSRDQAPSSRELMESRATTLAQQLEMLLRRQQELTVQSLIVDPNVSLLATASPPERPSSLHPLLVIPPSVIVFALLGCFVAVVLNRFDRTLHTETDATEALHVPCLGVVPSLTSEQSKHPKFMLRQPASDYAKAIRSVLVSLLTSSAGAPPSPRILLISSSVAGEGKTTLAWSVSLHAARLGLRTLLLDAGQAPIRRDDESGSLFRSLTLGRSASEMIKPIQDLGIDYLPAGLSDHNRLRLLAAPSFSPHLRQTAETYDLVVIDGPSLDDAPEAALLAGCADHVLFVVRSASTQRELAQAALMQFARADNLNTTHFTRFSSVLMRADRSRPSWFGRRADRVSRQNAGKRTPEYSNQPSERPT